MTAKPRIGERKSKGPTFQRRSQLVRLPNEIAQRIRDGHPWIFAEALRGRALSFAAGQVVDVVDGETQFVARALYDQGGSPLLRVFSRRQQAGLSKSEIMDHLAQSLGWRAKMMSLGPHSCYRVLSGDVEGVPAVTVDQFGPYLLYAQYSAVANQYHDDLISALAEQIQPAGIYLQRRYVPATPDRPRPPAELLWGTPAPPEVIIQEGRTRFVVDVTAPGNPGLFPDMRWGRAAVARLAGGRRVLNCFSFTGGFSVYAAQHGAKAVVSVDNQARAHGRARRNFSENTLDLQQERFEFITADTFAALARMIERQRVFDLVILDPPTFSNAKGHTFTALRDYAELFATALKVTARGGVLCAASNAAKLPAEDLDRAIGRGAALAGRQVMIIHKLGQPPDFPTLPAFPESAYLKFFIVQAD